MSFRRRVFRGLASLVSTAALAGIAAGCAPEAVDAVLPAVDMCPPALLAAGPVDERTFVLDFDEVVRPVASGFWFAPAEGQSRALDLDGGEASSSLALAFPEALLPGGDYRLAGEVADGTGNRTRLVLSFCGYNPRPPALLITEVQTGRNSSTLHPHRDFVELLVLSSGNLGGVELSWTSASKLVSARLPPCEARPGDLLVLHLAPEGLSTEVDEVGGDLGLSGGVDSSSGARDFWTGAGALSDATGALLLRARPGGDLVDCLFYADEAKTGSLPDGRLKDAVLAMAEAGLWRLDPKGAAYLDGHRWKPSTSRSIIRLERQAGDASWETGESGGQSPGLASAPQEGWVTGGP